MAPAPAPRRCAGSAGRGRLATLYAAAALTGWLAKVTGAPLGLDAARAPAVANFSYVPGTGFAWNGGTYTDPALAGQVVGKGSYFWDGAAGTWFWIDPVNDILFVGMIQRLGGPGGPALQEVTKPLVYQALR